MAQQTKRQRGWPRRLSASQHCATWQPVAEHENTTAAAKLRDADEALYFMQSHVVGSPTAFVSMASE
jgi:DNA-binding GntR family transcriptional regulator